MDATTKVWDLDLSPDMALIVKNWRCVEGQTWRGVAACADQTWHTTSHGNQLFGEDLCQASARILGEDPHAEPWN